MEKIILRKRKFNQFTKKHFPNHKWKIVGFYPDGSLWFRDHFATKPKAFKEMFEMSNGKNIAIKIED